MPSIAITGGIACGKSHAIDFLSKSLTVTSFNADKEISTLLEKNTEVAGAIKKTFGSHFYSQEGKPNKKLLRELILSSPQNKETLESILHPRLRKIWQPRALAALHQTDTFFLAEIPLLYENNLASFFDYVIVIASSESLQIKRLVEERNLPYQTASRLIQLQQPLIKKIERADYVLWNDGKKNSLDRQLSLLAQFSLTF